MNEPPGPNGEMIDREQFYANFREFLLGLKPDRDLPPPSPDTHLWEAGYLDSFAMLQVVDHLEAMLGQEIALGPNALPSFFTLHRIYETYVGRSDRPVQQGEQR
jgi:acyl carrier protein